MTQEINYLDLLGEGAENPQAAKMDQIDNHEDNLDVSDAELKDLDESAAIRRLSTAFSILGEDVSGEALQEAQSIVRLNKQAKLSSLTVRMALILARAKQDPLYTKYAKFNGLRLQLRELIVRKYGPKATQRARALLNGQTVQSLNQK